MNHTQRNPKKDHEYNYLLKKWLNHRLEKWGKKQSIENRKKLVKKLEELKSNPGYQASNRENPELLFNLIDTLD
jgi:hypothetical protein